MTYQEIIIEDSAVPLLKEDQFEYLLTNFIVKFADNGIIKCVSVPAEYYVEMLTLVNEKITQLEKLKEKLTK